MATQLKCPKCGSVIYSRRHPVCGRCGAELPASVLFNPTVRKNIEKIIEQDKKREAWNSKFPGHDPGYGGIVGEI